MNDKDHVSSKTVTPDWLRTLSDDDSISRHVLKMSILQAAACIETLQADVTDLKEQRRNLQHDLMMARLERGPVETTGKLRYRGERPTPEQRERCLKSGLYDLGDAVLVWINEGDLYRVGSVEWQSEEPTDESTRPINLKTLVPSNETTNNSSCTGCSSTPCICSQLIDPFADIKPLKLPDLLATAEGKEFRELGYIAIVSLDNGTKCFTRREACVFRDWLSELVSRHDE